MRVRVSAIIPFLLIAGGVFAQDAAPAKPHSSVLERVCNSQNERMRWEAAQTWLVPAMPAIDEKAANRTVHIDPQNQPALSAPKLRREWLRGSSEATTTADLEQINPDSSTFQFVPKHSSR